MFVIVVAQVYAHVYVCGGAGAERRLCFLFVVAQVLNGALTPRDAVEAVMNLPQIDEH